MISAAPELVEHPVPPQDTGQRRAPSWPTKARRSSHSAPVARAISRPAAAPLHLSAGPPHFAAPLPVLIGSSRRRLGPLGPDPGGQRVGQRRLRAPRQPRISWRKMPRVAAAKSGAVGALPPHRRHRRAKLGGVARLGARVCCWVAARPRYAQAVEGGVRRFAFSGCHRSGRGI